MKVKISRSTKEPAAGDCYHVTDSGPCLITVGTHYNFVVLETGIILASTGDFLTAKALVDATDCRRINDPLTLTPD
jgi:hypothetical protein